MTPRCSLFHLTGNPNVRHVALGLSEAGLLHEVVTMLGFRSQRDVERLSGWVPGSMGRWLTRNLKRRCWDLPPGTKFSSYPLREAARTLPAHFGLSKGTTPKQREKAFTNGAWLDERVARRHLDGIQAIYGYEDTCATTFAAARRRGILCLYDLPIMHYAGSRRIMQEESDLFPDLAGCLHAINEPEWKIKRKDQELELADHVLVASSLTRNSLIDIGYPADKITVIPYGSPTSYFTPQPRRSTKFTALFVGLIGPRKGVHYLLRAWRELALKDAELVLVGMMHFDPAWFERETRGANVRHVGSVPHHELGAIYNEADMFVFPSLIEGFGLVLLEAMSCGLPVLTTPHTAGPDIVAEGHDGFIVPIRSVDALKEKLQWAYDHRDDVAHMGKQARQTAERFTWAAYRKGVAAKVGELMAAR